MMNTTPRAHVRTATPPISADPESASKIIQTAIPDSETIDPRAKAPPSPTNPKDKHNQKHHRSRKNLPTPPDTDTDTNTDVEPLPTPKLTKKQKKKQKQASDRYDTDTEDESDGPLPTSTTTTATPTDPNSPRTTTLQHPSTSSPPMPPPSASKAYPLLVCSIGNPGPAYANTLHSAGHTVLTHITSRKSYQPFRKGLSGLVAYPDNTTFSFSLLGYRKEQGGPPEDDFTFWQSTTLMNVSGPAVKKAWGEFSRQVRAKGQEARLVVVHDELEAALGKVSVRDGGASPKGHNGLKSCQQNLGGVKWWRVGVGIGRPESREPSVVSRYVLGKMSGAEQGAMEKASMGVMEALRQISEGKR